MSIYLDHAATTPMIEPAIDATSSLALSNITQFLILLIGW